MAKIVLKSGMVRGTNYVYHLVDFQGTDIGIDVTGDQITSSTTDFTVPATTNGVTRRAVEVGDIIYLSHTGTAANEGVSAEVATVAANTLGIVAGSWSAGAVDEVATADINVTAQKKTFQFLEASGLTFVDGVQGITWASVTVDDWDTQDFDRYPRIFTSIEPRAKSIAALNGWEPHDDDTRKAIRDTALEIRATATSAATRIYGLLRSDPLDEATDQFFIWPDTDPVMDAPTAAVTQGFLNELVEIYNQDLPGAELTNITQANPAVITLPTGHGFADGDVVEISGVVGMTEVNGNTYRLANSTATTAELTDVSTGADIDSSGFTAYTSGGILARYAVGAWNYRCLEPGKTHLQGQVTVEYAEIYPVPSNNGIDPKLADGAGTQLVSDGTVSAGGIYANVDVNVDVTETYSGDVDGANFDFYGFVDADSQSNVTVHTKIHWLLRQTTNINQDVGGPQIRGDKTPPITSFLGDQLTVDNYYLLNYDTTTRNDLRLLDDTGTERVWPKINTITVTGGALAQGGTFSIMHKNTFGLSSVVYLQNEGAVDQQDITIGASVSIVIAYSTYAVDGHTPNTPIELVLSWNRPGFIEPDHNEDIVLSGSDITVPISITPDPSYVAA